MTIRALALGVLLGMGISAFCFFNDFVIQQTFLIGNHLPASVFGFGILLVVLLNPLLRWVSPRWVLTPGEIAVILALGLAVCAWPGSGLFRYWVHTVALPAKNLSVQTSWQTTRVMSYLPGGSPLLAEGYLADDRALVKRLAQATNTPDDPVARQVWNHLEETPRQLVARLARQPRISPPERAELIQGLNVMLSHPTFADPAVFGDAARRLIDATSDPSVPLSRRIQQRNRDLLDAAFPGIITPRPRGAGLLLNDGELVPEVTDRLFSGGAAQQGWSLAAVPWSAWWPTIRFWGGLVLLLGLAMLCLLVVVHPQWAQREVLPYPTVEFLREITAQRSGGWLPDVAGNRLFWIGFGVVAAIHLINGFNAWFPEFPPVTRSFNFNPLSELFPNARRVEGNSSLFMWTIYPSVIGFGYLIQTRVSLSLGLSLVLWVMLGSWMIGMGASLNSNRLSMTANGPMLRFGAYIGMTLMILYFGRRHYFNVLRGCVGLSRAPETPAYTIWAARLMFLATAGAVYLLSRGGGLSLILAVGFVTAILMLGLVLARINVETGLFYCQPDWYAGVILAGLMGATGVGTEGLVVLLLASLIVCGDPRENIAPYLANGLRMVDRLAQGRPGRSAPWLAFMIVAGFIVALVAALSIQYDQGLTDNGWSRAMPNNVFTSFAKELSTLRANGELTQATGLSGWTHLTHITFDQTLWLWVTGGLVLVLACAWARLRLPWWPLHPVLFLVWGTYPANLFAISFLCAAAVKGAIIKLGGERSYHKAKPLMIGLIAADLVMIVFWSAVGAVVYLVCGARPATTFRILPM